MTQDSDKPLPEAVLKWIRDMHPLADLRNLAILSMREQAKIDAKICNLLKPLQVGQIGTELELHRTDAFIDAREAIKRAAGI